MFLVATNRPVPLPDQRRLARLNVYLRINSVIIEAVFVRLIYIPSLLSFLAHPESTIFVCSHESCGIQERKTDLAEFKLGGSKY